MLQGSYRISSLAQAAGWQSWQAKGGYRQANQASQPGKGKCTGKKGFMQQAEMNNSDDPDQ